MYKLIILCVSTFFVWGISATAEAKIRVLSSIKPAQILVEAIGNGLVESHLLVDGEFSAHDYQLRPSDRVKLEVADVIVWFGPEMEAYLGKPMARLSDRKNSIALLSVSGLQKIKHAESLDSVDPHVWLNPKNGLKIINAIAATLAAADPDNKVVYLARAKGVSKRLQSLSSSIHGRLSDYKQQKFAVTHNSSRYFQQFFGLAEPMSIGDVDEIQGLRGWLDVIETLQSSTEVNCLFSQKQHPTHIPSSVQLRDSLRQQELDPLGSSIEPASNSYEVFLREYADGMIECFEKS